MPTESSSSGNNGVYIVLATRAATAEEGAPSSDGFGRLPVKGAQAYCNTRLAGFRGVLGPFYFGHRERHGDVSPAARITIKTVMRVAGARHDLLAAYMIWAPAHWSACSFILRSSQSTTTRWGGAYGEACGARPRSVFIAIRDARALVCLQRLPASSSGHEMMVFMTGVCSYLSI